MKSLIVLSILFIGQTLGAEVVVFRKLTGEIIEIGSADVTRFKDDNTIGIAKVDGLPKDMNLKSYFYSAQNSRIELVSASNLAKKNKLEEAQKDVHALVSLLTKLSVLDTIAANVSDKDVTDIIAVMKSEIEAEIQEIYSKY